MVASTMRVVMEWAALNICGRLVRILVLYALGGPSCPLAWNVSALAITAIWGGYVYWRDRSSVWKWGEPRFWALLAAGAFVGFPVARGSSGLARAAATTAAMLSRPLESAALDLCLLTPIREELFYRGFLLRRLSARIGLWPALAVSALFFGLAHPDPVKAAAAGLVLGLLYSPFGTGRLAVCIAYHVLFNLTLPPPRWLPVGY